MSLYSRAIRAFVLAALVMAAACRSQPVAVNPNDSEIVATVQAILDKTAAAADAADAEGCSPRRPRTTPLMFITDVTMLTGYDEALAAFLTAYALLSGSFRAVGVSLFPLINRSAQEAP